MTKVIWLKWGPLLAMVSRLGNGQHMRDRCQPMIVYAVLCLDGYDRKLGIARYALPEAHGAARMRQTVVGQFNHKAWSWAG